jgi:hypothetical protein
MAQGRVKSREETITEFYNTTTTTKSPIMDSSEKTK